jgi:hypothetical protein
MNPWAFEFAKLDLSNAKKKRPLSKDHLSENGRL